MQYKTVPTVGPSDPILSYLGALRFFRHGGEMIQEGYNKAGISSLYNVYR